MAGLFSTPPVAMKFAPLARRCFVAACLAGLAHTAQAQLVLPEGAAFDLGSGTFDLACSDFRVAGQVVMGSAGVVASVRDLAVMPNGSIHLNGASIQLAQDFTNDGQIIGPGQVTRLDGGAACPLKGQAGPLNYGPPAPTPVPTINSMVAGLLGLMLALMGARRLSRRDGTTMGFKSGDIQ